MKRKEVAWTGLMATLVLVFLYLVGLSCDDVSTNTRGQPLVKYGNGSGRHSCLTISSTYQWIR
jgi:hypothetical protein